MIYISYVIPGYTAGAPSPEGYRSFIERFAKSYHSFAANCEHKLILIDSNQGLNSEIRSLFSEIPYEVLPYSAAGWDIGAHLFAARNLDAHDFILCLSTSAYFQREGWLAAFDKAAAEKGDGLFGSMSSFERRPHIRSTGFMIRAGWLHSYPGVCNSREEAMAFESGPDSITAWMLLNGNHVWLVTPQATVSLAQSRDLENVYRHGDQSNIWIRDRHTDLFDEADAYHKQMMTLGALNQRMPKDPPWTRRKKRIMAFLRHFSPANTPSNGDE